MRSVKKALTILCVGVLAISAAYAAQPGIDDGSSATVAAASGPAYGGPVYRAPEVYGSPSYHDPYYGSSYRGRGWGRGSGSGHLRVSFDFDGFASGCMPWNGWWH